MKDHSLRKSLRTPLISAVAVSVLLVSGCASDGDGGSTSTPSASPSASVEAKSSSLDDITVKGDTGKKPEVSFDAPLVMAESEHTVISEGDGAKVADGQQVTANMTLVSGTSGETLESSYDSDAASGFPMDTAQINQSLYDALIDVPVGSRVLLTLNGSASEASGTETLVYVVDVEKAEDIPEPLTRAEGEKVDVPKDLPQVTLDDEGVPSVSQPKGEAPTDLVVQPTIQGEGAEVKKGQTVTVNYSGWLWDDTSKTFDSSWENGQTFNFTVGNGEVIAGWDEGIEGQKVGSQVLLVVPPDKGYGANGNGSIPGNSTLIFVVDILSTVG